MATLMDGSVATGVAMDAGAGVVIALIAGVAVYRVATDDSSNASQ